MQFHSKNLTHFTYLNSFNIIDNILPQHEYFTGKSLSKFLSRSHSLSICNYDSKKHTNHGPIQKVCHLHNDIFIPLTCVTLSQFYCIVSFLLFSKNNKLWNERKEDFLCTWLLQRTKLYQRR